MKEDRTLPKVVVPCDRCSILESYIETLCSRLDAFLKPVQTPLHKFQLVTHKLESFVPRRYTGWTTMELIMWANAVGLEDTQYTITKI